MRQHIRLARFTLVSALLTIALATTVLCADPQPQGTPSQNLEELEESFAKALQAEEYARALEIGAQVYAITLEKHVATLVGIARVHVKLGEMDKALARIEEAAETSFWHTHHMIREDADFGSLRSEKRFRTMMRAAWMRNYITMLDRPERADFQKPREVMAALAIEPGERVADLGAGSGYFTIPLAMAVGAKGKVWATDLYQDLVDHIQKRAHDEKLDNVEVLKVVKDDPMLPKQGVDTILMVDAYHYLENRVAYNRKLCECLAPGGRIVVIDSIPRPPEERMPGYPQPHVQISREMLDAEMGEAGLVPVKVHEFLPEQYFVEYRIEPKDK